MNKLYLLVVICGFILTTGCASRGKDVIIDPAGVDMQRYQNDLAQCGDIAKQVDQKAGKGAVGGAILGGIVGSVYGGKTGARKTATVGALGGAVKGGAATRHEQLTVVKNCLRNRGYQVLN